jgi:hypothetical protein
MTAQNRDPLRDWPFCIGHLARVPALAVIVTTNGTSPLGYCRACVLKAEWSPPLPEQRK